MKKLLLALALCALAAGPALAQSWRPPMILWTVKKPEAGFYFGPYFFSDRLPLTTFLARFGKDERTLTDAFGLKHLYYFTRGIELTATTDGQIMSFTWYLQSTEAMEGRSFATALIQTDTGLGPGNTWNDVWLVQGKPHRQKLDETGDKLYVLEYHLGAQHDLDFYFAKKESSSPILKIGLYPRR